MRIPAWLRQSWWLHRGATQGERFGHEHPRRVFLMWLILLSGLAVTACVEASEVWRGAPSALAFAAGAAIAAVAFVAQRRQLTAPNSRVRSVLAANTLVGSMLGVPFVLGLGVQRPTPTVAALVAASDGYLVVLFATLTPILFLVRRRRAGGG